MKISFLFTLVLFFSVQINAFSQWTHIPHPGGKVIMYDNNFGYSLEDTYPNHQSWTQFNFLYSTQDNWTNSQSPAAYYSDYDCCVFEDIYFKNDSEQIALLSGRKYQSLFAYTIKNGVTTINRSIIGRGVHAFMKDDLMISANNQKVYASSLDTNGYYLLDSINFPLIKSRELINTNTGRLVYLFEELDSSNYSFIHSHIFSSLDTGKSWQPLYSDTIRYDFIQFTSSSNAYLISVHGKLYRSQNGGSNWQVVKQFTSSQGSSSNMRATSMKFKNDSVGIVSFFNNESYITNDYGQSWQLLSPLPSNYPSYFTNIQFLDSNKIYVQDYWDSLFVSTSLITQTRENQKAGSNLKIYPNPSSNQVSVQSEKQISLIRVRDLGGRLIHTHNQDFQNIQLPEQKGIYLMEVEFEDGIKVFEKVIRN